MPTLNQSDQSGQTNVEFQISINQQLHQIWTSPEKPLLWVLREDLNMTGTKFGCGISYCGVCTVHLDGIAVRSCSIPISQVGDRKITTIEGINDGENLHPVQKAWLEFQVPQCGYCQSGQIMSACALLKQKPNPTQSEINQFMAGNLCRCGTYNKIKQAIQSASLKVK